LSGRDQIIRSVTLKANAYFSSSTAYGHFSITAVHIEGSTEHANLP
jgi:hypothetical protein